MAEAIEITPVLEGKDAERFMSILFSAKRELKKHEREAKELMNNLPEKLRI